MREIRFRGKNIKTKEWVYGHLFFFGDGRYFITPKGVKVEGDTGEEPSEFILRGVQCFEVEPKTVGQYTNQENHEDKEIYEGDYVSKEMDNGFDYGEFEGVVELIDGKWVINNRVNHYEELFTEIEQIEILGNIYDNSELLEVEENEL